MSVAPRRKILARLGWAAVGLFGLFLAVSFVLFAFGETLFGSSRSTIDDYNRDALADAPVFPGARLVQVRIHERETSDSTLVRFREHLYVTTASEDDVRAFLRFKPAFG